MLRVLYHLDTEPQSCLPAYLPSSHYTCGFFVLRMTHITVRE